MILSYISRFCPFLEVQNFELHFFLCFFLGGGQEVKKNMFGEIMIFFYILGVISIDLGLFQVKVQIWKIVFGVAKFQIFFAYA